MSLTNSVPLVLQTKIFIDCPFCHQGMRNAFGKRDETCTVTTFYPYEYAGFLETSWDLIIIEGWFTLIDEFISLARLHASPSVVILFFCLDPVYPGMSVVERLEVDGFLTNSRLLLNRLRQTVTVPTQYLPLAADPYTMRPHDVSTPKQWGAVYIGKHPVKTHATYLHFLACIDPILSL